MKKVRALAVLVGLAAPVALVEACGARTGLLPSYGSYGEPDAASQNDAQTLEDVILPGLDVQPFDVVRQLACEDASDTLIYTVTTSNSLLRFDPSSAQFTRIGTLDCPDPLGRNPFSMAVDRQGNAYVLYYSPSPVGSGETSAPGSIFKANLNTAACEATSFIAGQSAFYGFGMGFVADPEGGGETLYVASNDEPSRLGAIDESTLSLSVVGTLPSYVLGAELTGTGDGRLYSFYSPGFDLTGNNDEPTYIGQINDSTAAVIAQAGPLNQVEQGAGWAFAFWGGNFYIFTSPDSETAVVQRYDPTDGTVVQVATYPEVIDGAGVSTCAPVQ